MNNQQTQRLIQENLENCWRALAKTGYLTLQNNNAAIYMDSGTPEALLNSVIRFCPTEKNLEQEIQKIEQFYKIKNLPFCWWIPQNELFNHINRKLFGRGFRQTMECKGMALDFSSLPLECALPDNIHIVQATTPEQLSDWIGALRIAFDMDEDAALWYKNMFAQLKSELMPCYVAYCGDQPVSSLTLFLDKKSASFYNVGTIPDFRHQGLTTAMTFYCLEIARQKGYTWATLQANPNSVRLYTRMGFKTYIDYRLYFK